MDKKIISLIIALVISIVFMFFAIRPGIFNMIGYTISLLIFGDGSSNIIKYEKVIIYSFDALCGLIVFWIIYKVANSILKSA
jgi:hypothetical protein